MATRRELGLDLRREFIGEYKTARGRLAEFLADLNPVFRRFLTGQDLHPFDNIDYLGFTSKIRRDLGEADRRYLKLLADVCRESRQGRTWAHANSEFLDNSRRAAILYRKKRGAPRKPSDQSADLRRFKEAVRIQEQLVPGMAQTKALRNRGGYKSDPTEIRNTLRAMPHKYTEAEIDAMVACRHAASAAAYFLAGGDPRRLPTIRSSITRGRLMRLRRSRKHPL